MCEAVDVRDGRRRDFFIVDNALITRHGRALGVYGIAVYNALAMHAGMDGKCNPSVLTIANEIGAGKRRVQEAIALIAELGLMTIVTPPRGVKATNVYLLTTVAKIPEITIDDPRTQCMGACAAPVDGCTECMGAPRADKQEELKPSFAKAQDGFAPAVAKARKPRPPQPPKPMFDAYCRAWHLPPNGGRHVGLAGEFDRDCLAAGATVAEFDVWIAAKRLSKEWGKYVKPHSTTRDFLAARDAGEIGAAGQSIDPETGRRVVVWENMR